MSAGFSVPGATQKLPTEVQFRIDRSVEQFEAKFSGFGMLMIARTNGWIEEYRKELEGLALLCLRRDDAGTGAGVGGPR